MGEVTATAKRSHLGSGQPPVGQQSDRRSAASLRGREQPVDTEPIVQVERCCLNGRRLRGSVGALLARSLRRSVFQWCRTTSARVPRNPWHPSKRGRWNGGRTRNSGTGPSGPRAGASSVRCHPRVAKADEIPDRSSSRSSSGCGSCGSRVLHGCAGTGDVSLRHGLLRIAALE